MLSSRPLCSLILALSTCTLLACLSDPLFAQRLEVPRQHDRPPGPPVSAEEAVARMTVPAGFRVDIVAAEPDIVNPVAMAIDEQGRFWITESFEYPRREPGPGRDRIKVLEDTSGDGRIDKVTVFAEGLNIPSGIAVGHGGVWVGNAPDLLFLQDTDGDLRADTSEVIVTGFGRTDTHELPNAFTWGPDGWLYGLNGVFNYCHVFYPESNPNHEPDHPGWEFTCAMWRIHPQTREFQIFAEGTSNPWGIATNHQGDFFISACVIDHLWHIVEGAYYIRQGGPYPPHTWPMGSIVRHRHQKAAYCGITYFDSDNYPDWANDVLYMGNIHGSCINADVLQPAGSTYRAAPHPGFPAPPGAWDHDEYNVIRRTGPRETPRLADLIQANDPWFMPVVQATGPDGCLYVLDWYDRYHCYQDANADPEGIDRERGRLYRLVYEELGRRPVEDLGQFTDEALLDLALGGHNQYQRETARRLLIERLYGRVELPTGRHLIEIVENESEPSLRRLRALWILMGATHDQAPVRVTSSDDPTLHAWLIRNQGRLAVSTTAVLQQDADSLPVDFSQVPGPVRRQWITELTRLSRSRTALDAQDRFSHFSAILRIVQQSPDDGLIQHLAWQSLRTDLSEAPDEFVAALSDVLSQGESGGLIALIPRAADLVLDGADSPRTVSQFLDVLSRQEGVPPQVIGRCLRTLAERIQNGQLSPDEIHAIKRALEASFLDDVRNADSPLHLDACILVTVWGWDGRSLGPLRVLDQIARSNDRSADDRLRAFAALVYGRNTEFNREIVLHWLNAPASDDDHNEFRRQLLLIWAREDDPRVAQTLLDHFDRIDSSLHSTVIEVLTQRAGWTRDLLAAIQATLDGKRDENPISKDLLNLNQLRRIARFEQDGLPEQVTAIYGQIREGRNPAREDVIRQMRDFLNETPGDPHRGILVYNRVCGNCHKMHGQGAEVGPDITRNGRNNWDQLLSNVFDPSLVIGPGYQARLLATTDGRILTGLPVEESEDRVILKIQGGNLETIPRDQIEEYRVSEVSMMPEELEKLLEPQELADLFAYLALDLPPDDPDARLLPGAPEHER